MKNIISITVIIISIATFILVVKPGYMKAKEYEAKSKEFNQVLDNARKLQLIRDDLLKKQKELSRADIDRLEKLIPESVDNVKLIIEFQNIAERYGLTIQTASSNKEDLMEGKKQNQKFDISTRDYGTITLDFDVLGGYDAFLSFLKDIEDNLRITDIRALGISGGENGVYNFTLSVETYWLKDNI